MKKVGYVSSDGMWSSLCMHVLEDEHMAWHRMMANGHQAMAQASCAAHWLAGKLEHVQACEVEAP